MLPHKDYELPLVSLTHDEADPEWDGSVTGVSSTPIRDDGEGVYYPWHRPPGVHSNYWSVVTDEWRKTVKAYEADPADFCNSYYYLDNHPAFWKFLAHPNDREGREPNHIMFLEHEYGVTRSLYLYPVRCNPQTHRVEEDSSLNTKTEIWYEIGPMDLLPDEHGYCNHWHDYLLDGGADTYEQAIVEIARKVWEHYGNDRKIIETPEWKNGKRGYGYDLGE